MKAAGLKRRVLLQGGSIALMLGVHQIARGATILAVRPDQRVVCRQEWQETKTRVTGVRKLLQNLASLAA